MTATIIYLYRCFDREGQLLYVGVTDDVERRKREHAKDKYWWREVARVNRMAFRRRVEALWAEWAVISTCGPIYNCVAPPPPMPAGDVPAEAAPPPRVVDSVESAPPKRRPSRSKARARVRHTSRPLMSDQEAIQAMVSTHPDPAFAWRQQEVRRITGAGFGRIPRLIALVAEHHARAEERAS